MRTIDVDFEIKRIVDFIHGQMRKSGHKNVVIGLSGGIDSAVTLALCVLALGKEHVHAAMMPYRKSSPASLEDAKEVANQFDVSYSIVDISPMLDAYFDTYEPQADMMRRGNKMARERMSILYDFSAKQKALVAGTGNKSELMIGYCTQYGDNACAFEPIGHLYKTEVVQLAKKLNVPISVITKQPTADLWEEQTDENEMGITYQKLDYILYRLYELNAPERELKNVCQDEIELVKKMHRNSEFKRILPPVIE
jgi:NAD+ synthase